MDLPFTAAATLAGGLFLQPPRITAKIKVASVMLRVSDMEVGNRPLYRVRIIYTALLCTL